MTPETRIILHAMLYATATWVGIGLALAGFTVGSLWAAAAALGVG